VLITVIRATRSTD